MIDFTGYDKVSITTTVDDLTGYTTISFYDETGLTLIGEIKILSERVASLIDALKQQHPTSGLFYMEQFLVNDNTAVLEFR